MGKRGPSKTPTVVLSHRGSWRAQTRRGEIRFEVGEPPMPDGLGEVGQQTWRRLCEMLAPRGVLSQADAFALHALSSAYERFCGCGDDSHLAVKISGELLRWCREFGLTPASRSNVMVPEQQADDSKSAFFKVG